MHSQWLEGSSAEHSLVVLTCLRMMLRDGVYQKEVFRSEGVKVLANVGRPSINNNNNNTIDLF